MNLMRIYVVYENMKKPDKLHGPSIGRVKFFRYQFDSNSLIIGGTFDTQKTRSRYIYPPDSQTMPILHQ